MKNYLTLKLSDFQPSIDQDNLNRYLWEYLENKNIENEKAKNIIDEYFEVYTNPNDNKYYRYKKLEVMLNELSKRKLFKNVGEYVTHVVLDVPNILYEINQEEWRLSYMTPENIASRLYNGSCTFG